jgi:hypothetical protein
MFLPFFDRLVGLWITRSNPQIALRRPYYFCFFALAKRRTCAKCSIFLRAYEISRTMTRFCTYFRGCRRSLQWEENTSARNNHLERYLPQYLHHISVTAEFISPSSAYTSNSSTVLKYPYAPLIIPSSLCSCVSHTVFAHVGFERASPW